MRTRFETDGFLSDELSRFESQITDRYSDQLEFAKEVNRIAQEIIGTVQIDRDELRSNLMGTLLIRQVESFQAFVILVGKGLFFQAQIILRNIAESMFIVGAIVNKQTFAEEFIGRIVFSDLKMAKGLRNFLVRRGDEIPDVLKNLIKESEDRIKELEDKARVGKRGKKKGRTIQPFRTEEIAKIAQMEDFYDTVYRYMSLAVHTSPRSLNEVFIVGRNGEVEALDYQPRVDRLETVIFSATEMTLFTLRKVAEHFSLESPQRRTEEAYLKLEKLVDNHAVSLNFR